MKYIFIPFFIAITFVAFSQKKRTFTMRQNSSFPSKFIGNWKGTLTWTQNNGKPTQNIPVQLKIQPIKDSTNQYTWQIIYGANKADNRPYVLKKIDTVKNHWVIDEQNGIVLDSYLLQNRLVGAFTIGGQTLTDNYWIENNELHFEFISFPKQPQGTTGKGTEDIPFVETFTINGYQKAVLKKVK